MFAYWLFRSRESYGCDLQERRRLRYHSPFCSEACKDPTSRLSSLDIVGQIAMNLPKSKSKTLTDNASVCFASMYRIITITRLVESRDISWAKSDVFIWSSVEPSVGIISGCLPTLRPLMLHIMQSWFNFVPSVRSSSGKGSRSISLNPIDTIGKRRLRKISRQDTLGDSQFTELNDDGDADGYRHEQHSRAWRPNDDEMGSTTTTVNAQSDSRIATERNSPELQGDAGINVTTQFGWDEATRN